MATHTILVFSYYAIFVILMVIISLFLTIQLLKAEKIARPFLFSLVIFFLAYAFGNFFLTFKFGEYLIQGSLIVYDQKVNSFFTTISASIAPLLLSFQIEKKFLSNMKIFSKYHFIFILLFISFSITITIAIFTLITNPILLFDPTFAGNTFRTFVLPFFLGFNIFFLFTFLYITLKSSGKYRFYCFMIGIGWLINQVGNLLHQFVDGSFLTNITTTILFLAKWIGTVMTAYGFYKLYTLKNI